MQLEGSTEASHLKWMDFPDDDFSETTADYVFVCQRNDHELISVDVTDKSNPTIADRIEGDPLDLPNKVKTVDDYAVVSNRGTGGVTVIDVSDPENLSVSGDSGSESSLDNVYGIYLDSVGDHAYVSDREGAVGVYDISTKSDPVHLETLSDSILEGASDMIVESNDEYLFVACGGHSGDYNNDRLVSIDISNPSDLSIVDDLSDGTSLDQPDMVRLSPDETHAYVGGWDGGYLTAVDVTDPSNLTITDSDQSPDVGGIWGGHADYYDEPLLFVPTEGYNRSSADQSGVLCYDISDPGQLERVGEIWLSNDDVENVHDVRYDAEYLYLTASVTSKFHVLSWEDNR